MQTPFGILRYNPRVLGKSFIATVLVHGVWWTLFGSIGDYIRYNQEVNFDCRVVH